MSGDGTLLDTVVKVLLVGLLLLNSLLVVGSGEIVRNPVTMTGTLIQYLL